MDPKEKKYKEEFIDNAKKFIEDIRDTLDKAEEDLNSKDEGSNIQGAVYMSAMGMCLQAFKSNVDIILQQQVWKKNKLN